MIERAKACLQSGARETLRCAKTPHRSKRMLHSDFWKHGAGDLELPPWAVSMMPMPNDLPLKSYDSPRGVAQGKGQGEVVSATPADGPFLDFLYPPQALVLMRRTTGHSWERRNAKRLPEGFVQASRGYASRARGLGGARATRRVANIAATPGESRWARYQADSANNEARLINRRSSDANDAGVSDKRERTGKDRSEAPVGRMSGPVTSARSLFSGFDSSGLDGRGRKPSDGDVVPSGPDRSNFLDTPADLADPEAIAKAASIVSDGAKVRPDAVTAGIEPDEASSDTDFVDSPGDLAESSTNALDRLRSMISGMRRVEREDPAKQLEPTLRVIKLYDSMHAAGKGDVQLKIRLLQWLSLQRNSTADVRCAELYHSLPTEQRTLEVYQAMLTMFLRRGLHVQAVKLHKEALTHIENGDQVTKTFFVHAMKEHRWPLAMNVEAQYRLQNRQGAAGEELFWLHVSETPKLIVEAIELSQHVRALRKAQTFHKQVKRFCGRFYTEALVQEFQTTNIADADSAYTAEGMPKASIGHLFESLGQLDDDAPRIYQRMLLMLLRPKRDAYQFPQIHRVVSYVYLALRKTEHRIREDILMALLENLTRYWGRLRRQRELHHSLNVNALLADWSKYHGRVSQAGLKHVMSWHASRGLQRDFEATLQVYREHYQGYESEKQVLVSEMYLHARRADLVQAQTAFERAVKLTGEHGELPPLACWNVLIHAHSRVDSLESAMDVLQALVDKGVRPDEFTFHPIMEMLAKRGDVDGVKDMLNQFDTLAQKKRETAFTGSLLTALVNSGEIEEAEAALKDALPEVKMGNIRGSLTQSFNIVLTGHALGSDVDAAMRTFRWMKAEGIRMDANTYAALMQALTSHRQTDAAYRILQKMMPDEGLEPTAFHYAIVMTGYVNQGKPDTALSVHQAMRDRNIRPTFSSNAILLKARALKEHAYSRIPGQQKQQGTALNLTIANLKHVLSAHNGSQFAAKQPGLGRGIESVESGVPTAYFNFVIYIHGRRRCFEAVKEVLHEYQDAVRTPTGADPQLPIQLLAALMTAYLREKAYDEVVKCWNLAKEQADHLAKVVPVPQIKPAVEPDEPPQDLMLLQPPSEVTDAQEVGFSISNPPASREQASRSPTSSTHVKQGLVTDRPSNAPPTKLSPARQYILSRPLRFYLYALAAQRKTAEILSTVAQLFGQGYILDNRTWNSFIELLCRADTPLVLLAFTLTERFLIPHFPGWTPVPSGMPYKLSPGAKVEGLQYIRARYLRPGQLMPQYRTLVFLGSALLRLRRNEATGHRTGRNRMHGMEKYVGTVREVRKQAPKTVFAVQSMPTVDDAWQNKLLGRA